MTSSNPNVCQGSSRFKFGFLLLATSHNNGMASKNASAIPSMVRRANTDFDKIVSENEHLFSTGPTSIPPFPPRLGAIVKDENESRKKVNSREAKRKRIDRDQEELPLSGALMHSRLPSAKEGKALRQFPHLHLVAEKQ